MYEILNLKITYKALIPREKPVNGDLITLESNQGII